MRLVVAMPNLIHSIEIYLGFAATGLAVVVIAVIAAIAVIDLVVIAVVSAIDVELEVDLV